MTNFMLSSLLSPLELLACMYGLLICFQNAVRLNVTDFCLLKVNCTQAPGMCLL